MLFFTVIDPKTDATYLVIAKDYDSAARPFPGRVWNLQTISLSGDELTVLADCADQAAAAATNNIIDIVADRFEAALVVDSRGSFSEIATRSIAVPKRR